MHFRFRGIDAGSVPWSVSHLQGITRSTLNPEETHGAADIESVDTAIRDRLVRLYGLAI
jgi:hypothetical protein